MPAHPSNVINNTLPQDHQNKTPITLADIGSLLNDFGLSLSVSRPGGYFVAVLIDAIKTGRRVGVASANTPSEAVYTVLTDYKARVGR